MEDDNESNNEYAKDYDEDDEDEDDDSEDDDSEDDDDDGNGNDLLTGSADPDRGDDPDQPSGGDGCAVHDDSIVDDCEDDWGASYQMQLYGRAASDNSRPVNPETEHETEKRKHPSLYEWRMEKLSQNSLQTAFFGGGHKCLNMTDEGKPCHTNLWGENEQGLEALRFQRALVLYSIVSSTCPDLLPTSCIL